MIKAKTFFILMLLASFGCNSRAMDKIIELGDKLEPNRIYALKNVSSGRWLDGRRVNNQDVWCSNEERRPWIDGELQWELYLIDENNKSYALKVFHPSAILMAEEKVEG